MPAAQGLLVLPSVVLLLILSACDKPTTPTRESPDPASPAAADVELKPSGRDDADAALGAPFADAELFFELNATDDDLGLQLFVDSDDGWKRVRVLDPDRREMLLFQTAGRLSRLGITELRFESAEPSPEEVLALFPPGEYRFRGRTVGGRYLTSSATLSHDFPTQPTFTPSEGETVNHRDVVVEWNAPGAEQVEIIIEQDELEQVLDVTLSADVRRLRVPAQFLTPGMEYKIEVLSTGENGNRIITESTFRTAP